MRIAVIGTGYVGLVTGTCLAETGNQVICVDNDESKIKKLESGQITIYEPGLEKLFERNLKEGRLTFSTRLDEGVSESEIIFLALPTPPDENGSADLKHVLGVAFEIGKLLNHYAVIVDKSTVPVGTAEKVRMLIEENYHGEFDVVSNPEFLREGFAVEDFMKPDRIVIGSSSEKAVSLLAELYGPYIRQGNPIIVMDERSAELTKYAANSFLATKISFMNEIARLCEKLGADVDLVRKGMGTDERIGKRFLFPGLGYGGSCFPKDVKALMHASQTANYDFKILNAVNNVNENQRNYFLQKIKDHYNNNLSDKHFAIWGLAFKPNTDDIREAPALKLIDDLLQLGVKISAYDPEAMENTRKIFGDRITFSSNQYDCLDKADALIIATEWNEFRTPDFDRMLAIMREPVVFDGRNLFEVSQMQKKGFYYQSIGRALVNRLDNVSISKSETT